MEKVILNNNIQSLLINDNFIKDQDVKERTADGYKVAIKNFYLFLLTNNITNPTKMDIKKYKEYLIKSSYSSLTQQRYLRVVKQFFKWCSNEGIYQDVSANIKNFKVDTTSFKKDSLNEQDVIKIINAIDTTNEIGKRDKAIILLAITCGLRINEIRLINIEDIETLNNRYFINIQRKGHTSKDIQKELIKPIYDIIKDYLKTKGKVKPSDPLFTATANGYKGNRLSFVSVSNIIKKRFIDAGYNSTRLTAHSCRHTTGTMLFKSGADLFTIQHHLDHKDPKTSEIYINLTKRKNEQNEWEIYNQIFNSDKEQKKDLKQLITKLTKQEQEQVINYIEHLKGGII